MQTLMRSFAIAILAFFTALNGLSAQQPSINFFSEGGACGEDCFFVLAFPENFGQGPFEYQWSDGQSGQEIFICQPGCYSVTVADPFGEFIDTSFCVDQIFEYEPELLDDYGCSETVVNSDSLECRQVCLGSTVTYTTLGGLTVDTFTYLNIYNLDGGYAPDPVIVNGGFQVNWDSIGAYGIELYSTFYEYPLFCDALIFECISVVPLPEASIASTPAAENGTLNLCEGQPVYFEYTGTNADSLSWQFGDGGISSEADPEYTYTQAGNYQLLLTASNDCLCLDTIYLDVVVEATETPIVDCVGTLCEGMMGTYTASSSCNTFFWSVSDNGIIVDGGGEEDDYISVIWNEGPEGTIELLTEDCSVASCPEPVTLKVPIISEAVEVNGPELVCRGERSTYTIPSYEGTTINWTVGSGVFLESGQGTNEIVVRWLDNASFSQPNIITVDIYNCYLGCSGTDTIFVNVRPRFYVSGELEVCANSTENYISVNEDNGAPFNAIWQLESPLGDVVWQSATPTAYPSVDFPASAGIYRLTAMPADPSAFCQESYTRSIYVLPTPPAVDNIEGNPVICPGSVQAYEAISTEENVYFEWLVVNGGSSTTLQGNPINVTWGNTPPYEISVVQINTQGLACISPATMLEAEAFGNLVITGTTDGCLDAVSTFSTTDAEHIDYSWEITPASAGTIISEPDESSVDIVWHQAGNVEVSVTACGAGASTNITVNPLPEPVVQHPGFLCPNEQATVQTSTTYVAYEWRDESDNLISTDITPDLGPGRYLVIVTDALGCIGQETFHIQNYPESQVSISTPDPWIYCTGTPFVRMYAENTEEGYQYQWYQDGNPVGTNDPEYTATEFGNYYVEVTDTYGCSYTSNTINVNDDCIPGECGTPTGPSCDDQDIDFTIAEGSVCEERIYENSSTGFVPGSEQWTVFNQDAVIIGTSNDPNFTYTYDIPAFYRVRLTLEYPNPANPADPVNCFYFKVDTVLMVADFESTTVCEGELTEFEDITTHLPFTSITSWQWDFGDPASGAANTSTDQHPAHTFSAAGNFNVQLTVTDASGCISRITKAIEVIDIPAVDFAEPEVACANTASAFNADAPSAISFDWEFGDPASGDANTMGVAEAYHRYDAPGTYTVSLSVENIYGCSNSISKDITIAPNPLGGDIAVNPAPPICEGDEVTLTAPSGGVSWVWSTGETSESITVAREDVYEVTVTNADGCTYEPEAVDVEVIPAPEAYIRGVEYDENGQPTAYYYETYETCYGTPVFLETFEDINYSYLWSTGEQSTMVEYSEEKGNLLDEGTHNITLEITDQTTGCTAVIGPFVVVVHPLPDQPAITSAQPQPLCEGGNHTLSVSSPVAGFTYRWSNGATGTSITTEAPGIYTVTAINEFGCEQESDIFKILDGPPTHLIPNGCYTRCLPDTLCLPELQGVISYQWFFNGSAISPPEGTMPELIIDQEGSYYLELEYFNGCVLETDPLNISSANDINTGNPLGSIIGYTFLDINENGMIEEDVDSLISDIEIELYQNDVLLQETLSEEGVYGFLNIPAGDYTLCVDTTTLPPYLEPVWICLDTVVTGGGLGSGCGEGEGEYPFINFLFQRDCEPDNTFVSMEACAGESADYNGTPIPAGTVMDFTFSNEVGCDSVVTVEVQELQPSFGGVEVFVACEGEFVDYYGTFIPAGTVMEVPFTNAVGCDSIVTVEVIALQLGSSTVILEACQGQSADYNGTPVAAGTSMDFVLTSADGCDSIVTVQVEELLSTQETVILEACQGQSVDYNGTPVAAGTSMDFVLTNAVGCDSVVTVTVAELEAIQETMEMIACEGETVFHDGQELQEGPNTFEYTSAAGCDSTLIITLEIEQASSSSVVLEACPDSTINFHGNLLKAGESATVVLASENGCDSTVTANVEALPLPEAEYLVQQACPDIPGAVSVEVTGQTQAPYQYALDNEGFTFSDSFTGLEGGNYTLAVKDNNGCVTTYEVEVPAVAPLETAILQDSMTCEDMMAELTVNILSGDDGQLDFSWDDGETGLSRMVETPGLYTLELSNGCETITREVDVPAPALEKTSLFYMPTAFSPNGDGMNDFFEAYSAEGVQILDFELEVFDRYGGQLFHSESPDKGWDGHCKGQLMNAGAYVWQLKTTVIACGQEYDMMLEGDMVLMR